MSSRNVSTNIDLAQNNDTSLPESGFTRIKAKPDGAVYVIKPDGSEIEIKQNNGASGQTTVLKVDGGASNTLFPDYLLRLDFGANGSTINPSGTP